MRKGLNAIIVLAALTGLAGQEQPSPRIPAASNQSSSLPAYRILQLVSAGNTDQKINDAAAAGYRFVMLQPTAAGGGITVVMKKCDADRRYEYRLLAAEPGKEQLQSALNQAGHEGFRLIAHSLTFVPTERRGSELLLWPSSARERKHNSFIHIAVMERASPVPASYEYRVSSAFLQSSAQKDLAQIAGQGFTPVASIMELSNSFALSLMGAPAKTAHFVLVFEKNGAAPGNDAAKAQYILGKIGDLPRPGVDDVVLDVTDASIAKPGTLSERQNVADEAPQDSSPSPAEEEVPVQPKLQANAIAGTHVLFVSHFAYSNRIWLLAAKLQQTPPSYRLLLFADAKKLEKALNSAAHQGFRLLPDALVDTARSFDPIHGEIRDLKHKRQVLALLRQDTGSAQYDYRIVHVDDAVDLLKQMNEAAAQGYDLVSIWGTNAVMEKVSANAPSTGGGL